MTFEASPSRFPTFLPSIIPSSLDSRRSSANNSRNASHIFRSSFNSCQFARMIVSASAWYNFEFLFSPYFSIKFLISPPDFKSLRRLFSQ